MGGRFSHFLMIIIDRIAPGFGERLERGIAFAFSQQLSRWLSKNGSDQIKIFALAVFFSFIVYGVILLVAKLTYKNKNRNQIPVLSITNSILWDVSIFSFLLLMSLFLLILLA
jgi:hypothetical protein